MLAANIELLRRRIARACQRAGRDPADITLVAVTKGLPASRVAEAVRLGLREIGENRVQEARDKRKAVEGLLSGAPERIRWHLIGHLQRNKTAAAVRLFDVVHSVDSLELVKALEQAAEANALRQVSVMVQVNMSGESTKHGCRPEEAEALLGAIRSSRHLSPAGLMTMAPWAEKAETVRPVFAAMRALREQLGREAGPLPLSMGMSADFEVAIEEGADLVRIGTALFGERTAGKGTE